MAIPRNLANLAPKLSATGGSFASTLGVGGATPAASGAGITFPDTWPTHASSDANTLDDYEEGTWTPSVGGTATYTSRSGTYTKVGRFVYVTCLLQINTIGTGSTIVISGLPFVSAGGLECAGSVGYFTTLARNVVSLMPATNSNTVVFSDLTAAANGVNLNAGVLGNSTDIRFSLTYYV